MMARGLILAAVLFLSGISGGQAGDLRIDLRLEARVPAGEPVTLEQIAGLSGPLTDQARTIAVGEAPGLKTRSWLERESILQMLESGGIPREAVQVNGAAHVQLIGAGLPLSSEKVEAAIGELLAEPGHEQTAQLLDLRLPVGAEVPAGDYAVTAALPPAGLRTGTSLIPLTITHQDGTTQQITAQARIEVRGPVLVAARDLLKGHKLTPADLRMELRPLRPGVRMVTDPAQLGGMVTRGPVKAGTPLLVSQVIKPAAVEPGKTVRARFRQGSVELDLETIARSRGQVGDVVSIDGFDGKRLTARVIDEGRVVVTGSEEIEEPPDTKEAL